MELHEPPWSSMSLHGAPWSSMELHGGLHGVPDNVGGPIQRRCLEFGDKPILDRTGVRCDEGLG